MRNMPRMATVGLMHSATLTPSALMILPEDRRKTDSEGSGHSQAKEDLALCTGGAGTMEHNPCMRRLTALGSTLVSPSVARSPPPFPPVARSCTQKMEIAVMKLIIPKNDVRADAVFIEEDTTMARSKYCKQLSLSGLGLMNRYAL